MEQVTIGADDYPSFASVDFADVYLAGDVMRAPEWALRNEDAKGRGLSSATRMLQRVGVQVADPIVPVLAEVTSMLAADLLAKPALFADASGSSNVKTAKAGSAQVEFFAPVKDGPPIPMAMWQMLVAAGLVVELPKPGRSNAGAIITGLCDEPRPLGGRWRWDWPIAAGDHD